MVSSDGKFVLVFRISKYWLVGHKENTVEVLLNTNGNPNKIKRAEKAGEFWVSTARIGYMLPTPIIVPEGVRFNSTGHVLQTVPFVSQYSNNVTSLVQEKYGKLYVGSQFTNFVGVYSN